MQNYKTVKWFQMSKVRCWSSVQLLSCVQPCDPMDWSTPGLRVHHNLLELTEIMSIKSVMPSNHLILCHPLLQMSSIFPRIRVFSSESVLCIRWPKYWSFSFSISQSVSQSVQSLSHVWLFVTPWTTARQASLSTTNSRSPPKPTSTELVMSSKHLILCHPLLLLPLILPSIGVFSQ